MILIVHLRLNTITLLDFSHHFGRVICMPGKGIEVAEFRYQPIRWPHPSRFVVIRRFQPEEFTNQYPLFNSARITIKAWSPIYRYSRSTCGVSTPTESALSC